MIIRLTARLGEKIGVCPPESLPPAKNPYADWSAHLFTVGHIQYLLITNTATLYSMVMPGKGITTQRTFLKGMSSHIERFLGEQGHQVLYETYIALELAGVSFSKALNRAVTGSMKEFVLEAKWVLREGGITPHDVSSLLNEMPMSYIRYDSPMRAFSALADPHPPSGKLLRLA